MCFATLVKCGKSVIELRMRACKTRYDITALTLCANARTCRLDLRARARPTIFAERTTADFGATAGGGAEVTTGPGCEGASAKPDASNDHSSSTSTTGTGGGTSAAGGADGYTSEEELAAGAALTAPAFLDC